MHKEQRYLDSPDVEISFGVPFLAWEKISQSDSWKDVDAQIEHSQRQAELERKVFGNQKTPETIIHYAEMPMMKNMIDKVSIIQKRLIVSMIVPMIALIVSVIALLL